MGSLKFKLLEKSGSLIQNLFSWKEINFSADIRPVSKFTLVYFCGSKGINYLNAALYSVYKSWKQIPNITIISDGTPAETIEKELVNWPLKVSIISWKTAADYFNAQGESDLYFYASNNIWGKKLVGILYLARQSQILYSDSDVLWFNDPGELLTSNELLTLEPKQTYLKMMQEASDPCYDTKLLAGIDEENIDRNKALNAGIMLVNGDLTLFPKWEKMMSYIKNNKNDWMGWTEQTVFAVLSNFYKTIPWKKEEMLIKVDDLTELVPFKYKGNYKTAVARHYVFTKKWLFWRDFIFFFKNPFN